MARVPTDRQPRTCRHKKGRNSIRSTILLSILAAAGEIDAPPDNALFFGELSLTGELRSVCGALSMALAARDAGFKTVFVPAMNAAEASYASGVTVFPIHTLNELLGHLNGRKPLTPCAPPPRPEPQDDALDFAHVLGQHAVKRALEIAAAGGHNVLLSGPPGSGKSMAAKRFSTILPPLSDSERLEVIRVWSAIGRGQEAVERAERPFRAPHHNSSANAMAGGSGAAGRLPVPGEITLAHRGVLFLDEFPEFRRDVLETLRQPLEDGRVTISRVAGQVTYPARFQLIAAMNPCKCGWYGTERCTCTKAAVQQYLHRLSGPLLDRIDLQVAVQPVEYAALAARGQASEEHSADIRARVLAARERQYARQGADVCNAAIPPPQLAEHCPLSADASRMFAAAFQRLGLTARAHDRVLRVARTIADLADSSVIEAEHLAEALQYRSLDRAAGS
ncbi:MAG: YifB family Mg chelatase-like AAA ATPase [Butyricicoccus sp.]